MLSDVEAMIKISKKSESVVTSGAQNSDISHVITLTIALGKEFLRKNKKHVFAEGYGQDPRQRISQKK